VSPATDELERDRANALSAQARVLVEQIGYVHDQGVAGASAMLAVALLYVSVLWPVTPHQHLFLWLAAMVSICAARFAFALHWRRSGSAHATPFWSRAALIINALAGAAWGYAAVALFPLGHPDKYIVAAFILVGMPAGALTSLGAWAPAFAAYAVLAMGPFVVWMFSLAQLQFVVVGIAGTIFCAYLLRQAQQTSATIARNIVQRIELEQLSRSLAQARDAAEAASQAKTRFLANMSHELRTPLNAVVGLSDLMVDQKGDPRGRELALTMRQSALSLLGVIDHVLDMSRIEAGRIELRPRSFEVRSLMRDVHAMFRPEAERRRLAISVDVDGAVPSLTTGDPDRIRQILVNLIDNALKFTMAGSVTVKLTAATRGDGRYLLRFEVADTGAGVDESLRGRLFALLTRSDVASTHSAEGLGLGLAISAALVRLMGGEISYSSEAGRGAIFWFTCAVGIAPPTITREIALAAPSTVSRPAAPRILVVEDNSVNLELTRKMLEAFGCDVHSVTNGADGLRHMGSEAYDLVFMDVSMPGMDGIETTRAWRAREQNRESRLPIVALTANAMLGDRQACLAAGMDDYMAKPVTLDAMRRMVARHVPGVAS
jgi:signal transduction histidine kinase/ActR/RegA family two-component response regulator